jgi:hypothetical protein
MLSAIAAGNRCDHIKSRLEYLCFTGLADTIDLSQLVSLLGKVANILGHFELELHYPFHRILSDEHSLRNSQNYRRCEKSLKVVVTTVRKYWMDQFRKPDSRCINSCGPEGCLDWNVLCGYQDALRTHLMTWVDSITLQHQDQDLQSPGSTDTHTLLLSTTPAAILSNIWVLEFLAIVLKSPAVESLLQSLRVAFEEWLAGDDRSQWVAALPPDWYTCCTFWRDHAHGGQCQSHLVCYRTQCRY